MIKCLLGEADPFLARLLQRFAEAFGMDVVQTGVGEQVVELAIDNRPDLLILDVELPGEIRGWEAVRALRERYGPEALRIVSCSWVAAEQARCLAGEGVAHLQKPDLHYADFISVLAETGLIPIAASGSAPGVQ